jgi:hypothetical protein
VSQECTVIEFAGARGDHRVIEVLYEIGDGEIEIVAFGGFEGIVEVLELEFGGAAGFEVAFDHAEAVFGEDAGRGKSALEGLADFGGVGTTSTGKDEGLGDGSDSNGDDDLVGEFGELTGAGWADVGGAAHGLEDRGAGGESFGVSANHNGEFSGSGTDGSAGNGGVEVGVIEGFVEFAVGDGFIGADGAHIDVSGTGGKCVSYFLIEDDFLNGGTVFEHGDEDVSVPHSVMGGAVDDGSLGLKGLGFFGCAVPGMEWIASVEEVSGHRAAHEASAEEGDGREWWCGHGGLRGRSYGG